MEEFKDEVFKASLPIQIRFNDVDSLGHINNNVYFSFFDLGKTDYVNTIDPMAFKRNDSFVVIARIEVDFLLPIYYTESVVIETKVSSLGDKSGVFFQQIKNPKTGEVKCHCKSIFVAFDPRTQKSIPIPDLWRRAISEFEEVEL